MHRVKSIRKYLILTEHSLQSAMAYRVPFFLSLLFGVIRILVLYYIWQVVYLKQDEIQGFTLAQMVTYIFISYAVRNLYGFYTEITISNSIRDGSVAMELIKPLNYQFARFFESLGRVAVEGILIGLFVLILGFGLFRMEAPPTIIAGIVFGVGVVLSLLVNFAIGYIVGLLSFWTKSNYGILSKRFVVDFFSGGLVPLAFFPEWLKHITLALPFHAIVHVPVSIYLGKMTGVDAYFALLQQAIWVVILWGMGSFLWPQAAKTITIHGG
jgi:ABC-2 type transport system permease protein